MPKFKKNPNAMKSPYKMRGFSGFGNSPLEKNKKGFIKGLSNWVQDVKHSTNKNGSEKPLTRGELLKTIVNPGLSSLGTHKKIIKTLKKRVSSEIKPVISKIKGFLKKPVSQQCKNRGDMSKTGGTKNE